MECLEDTMYLNTIIKKLTEPYDPMGYLWA